MKDDGIGLMLRDEGDPRVNQSINFTSQHPSASVRLIGNFGATPLKLDVIDLALVESFWQSLKRLSQQDCQRIARLAGAQAKQTAREFPSAEWFE